MITKMESHTWQARVSLMICSTPAGVSFARRLNDPTAVLAREAEFANLAASYYRRHCRRYGTGYSLTDEMQDIVNAAFYDAAHGDFETALERLTQ